jgi:hypothetical protein
MARRSGLRASPPNFPQTRLAAPQCREPLSTFAGDQSFEPGVHDRSFLRDTAQSCRLLEQVIVNIQSCPHMYHYASFMHTVSRGRKVEATTLCLSLLVPSNAAIKDEFDLPIQGPAFPSRPSQPIFLRLFGTRIRRQTDSDRGRRRPPQCFVPSTTTTKLAALFLVHPVITWRSSRPSKPLPLQALEPV